MPLLQMVNPIRGARTYHPISVSRDAVAAVSFVNSTDVLFRLSHDPEDEICAVMFKYPICAGTSAEKGHEPIMKSVVIVTGGFRETAITLGLEEALLNTSTANQKLDNLIATYQEYLDPPMCYKSIAMDTFDRWDIYIGTAIQLFESLKS